MKRTALFGAMTLVALALAPLASTPAAAAGATLHAYVGGTGTTAGCPLSATPSAQCSLTEALSQAAAGDTVDLETSGVEGTASTYYTGQFTVNVGTAVAPLIIEPGVGATTPILDGGLTGTETGLDATFCGASCKGTILTIGSNVHAVLSRLTIQNSFDDTAGGIVMQAGANLGVLDSTLSNLIGNEAGGIVDDLGGTLGLTRSTVSNVTGGGEAGGIFQENGSATFIDSTFSNDGGDFNVTFTGGGGEGGGTDEGGAIHSEGATLTVLDSTFTGNDSGRGGALQNNGGTMNVSDSTFSANQGGEGGAIWNGSFSSAPGVMTVANSTFSGNSAFNFGDAISNNESGTGVASVVASTFAANTGSGNAAIDNSTRGGAGAVTVAADIFSGSNCAQGTGTWTDDGYNVGSDATCFASPAAAGDHNGGAALATQLGALANNGGPTQTMMPLTGNPALGDIPNQSPALKVTQADATSYTLCPVAADQRGDASLAGAPCDSGSVQADHVSTTPNPTSVVLGASTVTLKDSAVLANGGGPTGTITFTLVSPRGVTIDTETVTVSGNGTYKTPTGFTLPTTGTVTGTYQWNASYSGDANNPATADNGNASEQVVVSAASPALATAASPGTVVTGTGTATNDSATLTGGYFPTGTIAFTLFDPSGATVYTDVVPVAGNGTYSTTSGNNPGGFHPITTGTYEWVANYSGDGNNNHIATNLGDEPVTVRAPDADLSITKSGPPSAAPGTDVSYTVTVSNAGPDAASATMTDPLPTGTQLVSLALPAGWDCAASTATNVSCTTTAPPFGTGSPASFTIVVHVSPTAAGTLSNQATVASPIDHNSANNTSNVVVTNLTCDHTQGSASGTLRLAPGLTCITGATISGNLVVPAGASVLLVNSTIRGSLSATRPGSVAVCGTTVSGRTRVSGASGFVLLGDPGDDSCAPNTLNSGVTLTNNHGGVEVIGNHIGGRSVVHGNTGSGPFAEDVGTEIETNVIVGALSCSTNNPPASNDGHPNSVTGTQTGECAPPF